MDIGKKEPAHIPIYLFIALVLFAVRHEFSFSQDSLLFLPAVIFPGAFEQVDIGNVPLCFGVAGYSGAEEKDDGDGKNPFFCCPFLPDWVRYTRRGLWELLRNMPGEV